MRVQIDEARQTGVAAQIDDLRAGRNVLRAGPNANDAPRFDDNNGVDDCPRSIPQPPESNGRLLSGRVSSEGEER